MEKQQLQQAPPYTETAAPGMGAQPYHSPVAAQPPSTPVQQQNTGQAWSPEQIPPQQLGSYQPGFQQQPMGQPMMMMVPGGHPVPTLDWCPVTPDHQHVEKTNRGGMGVIIGVVGTAMCLPCFLVAIPMDTRISCRECMYVIKAGWGGM